VPLEMNRGVRTLGAIITLFLCLVGARFIFCIPTWAALTVALALALATFLALSAAARGVFVPGLGGRRLVIHLATMGLAMAALAVVLPMLPGLEKEAALLSLVLLLSALVYIAAALFEYARGKRNRAQR